MTTKEARSTVNISAAYLTSVIIADFEVIRNKCLLQLFNRIYSVLQLHQLCPNKVYSVLQLYFRCICLHHNNLWRLDQPTAHASLKEAKSLEYTITSSSIMMSLPWHSSLISCATFIMCVIPNLISTYARHVCLANLISTSARHVCLAILVILGF